MFIGLYAVHSQLLSVLIFNDTLRLSFCMYSSNTIHGKVALRSDKMMRRDRWSVSALEIIVSHLDVQHRVKYRAGCLRTAVQQSQVLIQAEVQLCEACLTRRDQHIATVHARQESFHELWEPDVTTYPVCKHEHDPVQFPADFDVSIEKISGRRWGVKGGVNWFEGAFKITTAVLE